MNIIAILLLWTACSSSPLNAATRWSPPERFLAALKIHDLAVGLDPHVHRALINVGDVEHFLNAEIDSNEPLDALRGGQILFLGSIADKGFDSETMKILREANIGGDGHDNESFEDMGGVRVAGKLYETLQALQTAERTVRKEGVQGVRAAAERQLAKCLPSQSSLKQVGQSYLELLFDGGNDAGFNGEALVELSKIGLGALGPESHYGFGTRRGFGLLKTSELISPPQARQLADVMADDQSRQSVIMVQKNATLHVDSDAKMEWEDVPIGFEFIQSAWENVAAQLNSVFAEAETLIRKWSIGLIYSRFGTDTLHQDFRLRQGPRRAIMTLYSESDPPATTFYAHNGRIYKVPLRDTLVITGSTWHAGPNYRQPRLYSIMDVEESAMISEMER